VKHGQAEALCERFWSKLPANIGAAAWGIVAPRFTHLIELLLKSAHARKLLSSSQRNTESLWEHLFDSLQALQLIEPESEMHILDAGSGNGFPGLPLALALPNVRISLAERSGSKAEFLEFAAASLSITSATVLAMEVGSRTWDALKPDLVIMRALLRASQLPRLFLPNDPSAPPFVVFTTAEKSSEWIFTAKSLGYGLLKSHAYVYPGTGANRETLKFIKR